jgi:hypothetical protein
MPFGNAKDAIALFAGGFGSEPKYPALVINVGTPEVLARMRADCAELESGKKDFIELIAPDRFQGLGVRSVQLKVKPGAPTRFREKTLFRELNRPGNKAGATFVWMMGRERWREMAELIGEMNHCSHQYLTDGGVDDAVVTLSYGEGMVLEP